MRLATLSRPDRRLSVALATAFLWHGGLLLSGSYRRTYDAYIHMFFGDHYARDWFSTWETRWYTGFTTTSYPPGTHQLIAIFSRVFGLEGAFVVVQLSAVLLLVLGVYRFSLIWVTKEAAGWAALLAVVSTSIAEVVHVFGQLPTSFSLALLLNTLPSVFAWCSYGKLRDLVMSLFGLAATTAAHHVTTLFGAVFFVGPVIAVAVLDALRTPRDSEPVGNSQTLSRQTFAPAIARRVRRLIPTLLRSGVVGFGAIIVLIIVVLPYWLWSSSDPIVQIPIPHATRDNFLENTAAGIVFFVVPWGMTLVLLPFALMRGFFSRSVPLAASVFLLFVLGTGGTTPIPRMLLRGAFDILTLDRFTIWSTIAVLPLAGAIVVSVTTGALATQIRGWYGDRIWKTVLGVGACSLLLLAVLSANFSRFRPLQPDRIDPEPIAAFMLKDQHDRWRYLTLGFGDQMAIVSAATTATTVDGNYHSARRLPELTSRSVERLEGAKFRGVPGIGSLQQFLATPETYNLKFVFSNDVFYDPLLWASGWQRLDRLQNDVVVWERADIPPLPDVLPTRELPHWQRLLWGTLPMTAMATGFTSLIWTMRGQRVSPVIMMWFNRVAAFMRRRWFVRLYYWLDGRLAGLADRVQAGKQRKNWHGGAAERIKRNVRSLALTPKQPSRVAKALLVFLCIAAAGAGVTLRPAPPLSTPEQTVLSYYDNLDFRRFENAWALLEPNSRPSFDQYQLELSVIDGLVSSYSKLDRVETSIVAKSPDRATILTELTYITSLAEYTAEQIHELRQVDGHWYLVAAPSDVSTTPDQFARSTEVTYLSQGRRQVTTDQSLFGDVLDRPRIETISARAIQADGRYAVVGEITNLDVDPADLTVTARFLDADGESILEHNASVVTIHKALPRETVPFRIDLEAIAGDIDPLSEGAGDFHPELFSAPDIEVGEISSIELITKAVVTGVDLQRDLQVQDLAVNTDEDGQMYVRGEIRNDGTKTATVPHVLVTLLRADGTVGWVDHLWVEVSVRPQRRVSFEVPLTDASLLSDLDVPLAVFGNGITSSEGLPFTSDTSIPLPEESGFASARVTVNAFYRDPS